MVVRFIIMGKAKERAGPGEESGGGAAVAREINSKEFLRVKEEEMT